MDFWGVIPMLKCGSKKIQIPIYQPLCIYKKKMATIPKILSCRCISANINADTDGLILADTISQPIICLLFPFRRQWNKVILFCIFQWMVPTIQNSMKPFQVRVMCIHTLTLYHIFFLNLTGISVVCQYPKCNILFLLSLTGNGLF